MTRRSMPRVHRGRRLGMTALVGAAVLTSCGSSGSSTDSGSGSGAGTGGVSSLNDIQHVVVIYQENWSFDSLYGNFPGANGWSQAGTITQVAKDGTTVLTSVPQPLDASSTPKPDTNFPATLPVAAYDASKYVPPTAKTGDIIHRFYQEQQQIDGGKNDKFVSWSDNGGLVLSYYDATSMPEGQLAQKYTLADNMFHSAFGGSFLNHQWLICACTPKWDTSQAPIPAAKVAQLDAKGVVQKDGFITPDGYVVNTSYTVNAPHPKSLDAADQKGFLVPQLTDPTIGDRLTAKGVSWKWYSGGWDNALKGAPDTNFQFHHQPFAFYKAYADGTQAKADHLQDETQLAKDISASTLPAVSFVKPLGDDNEHPGYANLARGQQHVADLVNSIENSAYAANTLIVVTYDENGGRYDHVAPPTVDKWGPGVRVPGILIAPFVKQHNVDHTQYETTSILALIEKRWSVQPLTDRDAKANPFTGAFTFSS